MLCEAMGNMGLNPADFPTDSFVEYMVTHHLLDSLSVLPYVNGNECLDAGTGAGLPGLILAMSRPEQSWLLVDSTGKKVRFLQQAIIELKITNVSLLRSRVEQLNSCSAYSTITARALGNLGRSYQLCRHLIQGSQGKLLLMKGPNIRAELAEIADEPVTVRVLDLDVPGLEGKRKLVEISSLPPA
jgi:16S rRNA (guanine527-N7)-methyltransferase